MRKIIRRMRSLYEDTINYVSFKVNNVFYKEKPKINGILFLKAKKGNLVIGEGVKFNSRASANPIGGDTRTSIVVAENAKLTIGNNVGISNSAFVCKTEINIGNNVFIGGSCKIWDTDFHPIKLQKRLINDENEIKSKKIVIKDGVWIGGSCIILKGVIIGENSVIAAGSVLSKSVPPNEIWGGNPAKFIKKVDI